MKKAVFKSEVGLSSYRASFESFVMPLRYGEHLTDEQWLLQLANFVTLFLSMEHRYFANHNQYLLKSLIEHGFIVPPWDEDE